MQVQSNSVNLVVGRDLRRNVLYSATMAVEIAALGKNVFYLNTYASENLLGVAFSAASSGNNGTAGANESDVSPDDRVWAENLPSGEWKMETLRGWITEHHSEVLIVNSFEFAALSRYSLERIARELIAIQRAISITVIVFSDDIKRDLEAHCSTRGAIGRLTAVAETVSKIGEEWRAVPAPQPTVLRGEIGVDDSKRDRVHEKQTLNKQYLPRKFGGQKPDPSVAIERDTGMSYHYGDFWEDPFHRGPMVSYLGKDMSLFARTPMLQKYLLDHADTFFMLGNTPTEAELRAKAGIIGPIDDVVDVMQVRDAMVNRR